MDPYNIPFHPDLESYIRRLQVEESAVDILEVNQFENTSAEVKSLSLQPSQLREWLIDYGRPAENFKGKRIRGGLRLILGPSSNMKIAELPSTYPRDSPSEFDPPFPLTKELLKLVIEKFHLPSATPWALTTTSPHFQRYSVDQEDSKCIGFTMRRSNANSAVINICLSISYNTETGITCAIVHGLSATGQSFIHEQVKSMASIANHPLLLPTLFSAHLQGVLSFQKKKLWNTMLGVEMASGQTGNPLRESHAQIVFTPEIDFDTLTKRILGVIQLSGSFECYGTTLLLTMQTIQDSVDYLRLATSHSKTKNLDFAAKTITEWLTIVSHKTKVAVGELQYIDKRGQAQMTAIYNYMAQRDARLSQILAEDSKILAADSREIAAAAKRDSSAMKAIAVLTMVFLPGTYIASLLAMPIFDFSATSGISINTNGQKIYWGVTVPLTVIVLAAYTVYLLWSQRQNQKQNIRDRNEAPDTSFIGRTVYPPRFPEPEFTDVCLSSNPHVKPRIYVSEGSAVPRRQKFPSN